MKLIKPRFYDDFVCIAERCTDNCCIGWEIDIDPVSLERFDKVGGDFGERLRAAIHRRDDVCTFAFGEGERCALLREDGRCELILHEGEDSLCDICALHPRFFGWYNGIKEAGLGLCCEEVCRLLFSDSTPLSFKESEIDEEWDETCSEELLQYLTAARERLFSILQNREHPFADRLRSAAEYVRELQECLDNGELNVPDVQFSEAEKLDNNELASVIKELIHLWSRTESIGAEWDAHAECIEANCDQLAAAFGGFLEKNREELWRYEHLVVYFCYRYFLNGVFEGEIVSRFGFAMMSVLAVALSDCLSDIGGELTEWQRILNLKLYSKQMEYSEDNLELAYDAVWDTAWLMPENIADCFA